MTYEQYCPIEWRWIQWHGVNGPMEWNSIQWHFWFLSRFPLHKIVSVGPGIRPQKSQRDNFTSQRPCFQESILGVPVCMKPSLRHARFLRYVYDCRINWKFNSWLKTTQPVNFVGRLGIGEPEHLRMRWRNVWTREKNAVPPDMALERRTKRVIPGFRTVRSLLDAVGPSLLSATDLASRYGIERYVGPSSSRSCCSDYMYVLMFAVECLLSWARWYSSCRFSSMLFTDWLTEALQNLLSKASCSQVLDLTFAFFMCRFSTSLKRSFCPPCFLFPSLSLP